MSSPFFQPIPLGSTDTQIYQGLWTSNGYRENRMIVNIVNNSALRTLTGDQLLAKINDKIK